MNVIATAEHFTTPAKIRRFDGEDCLVIRVADFARQGKLNRAPTEERKFRPKSLRREVLLTLKVLGPATQREVFNVLRADDIHCNPFQVSVALSSLKRYGLCIYDRDLRKYTFVPQAVQA